MKIKIYNKTTFWLGLFFLLLSLVYIIELIFSFESMSGGKIFKTLISLVFTTVVGFWSVQESLSHKRTKEAEQEKDERKELVTLKSANASIIITQTGSFILMIAAIIVWYVSGVDGFIGVVIAFGVMLNLSLFSQIFTYLYYNKKI